jgi:zinc carboxypeptidase
MGLEPMSWESIGADAFARNYLTHAEVTELVQDWGRRFPEFVRVRSIAKSLDGRDVWLLEIGKNPDEVRPAVWIDGNIHAAELLGSNVALYIARTLIELHSGSNALDKVIPEGIREAAKRGLFYLVPRISPDGAEEAVTAGRVSRSAPRDRRSRTHTPRWVRSDIDKDGSIRQIRIQHPAGEFVRHPDHPDVLVAREIGDAGPFFKVFPEGHVENFDGTRVPFPSTFSDNDSDFNRAFPSAWTSAVEGAGHSPAMDPETRAIVDFATASPQIFAWINLHTFGGVFIRPPFTGNDGTLNRDDLLRYQYLAGVGETHTGMRTVSAFDEITPDQAKPMTGTLASWAYGERGCYSWAVELWDVFADAGLPERKPFFRNYAIESREQVSALVKWDRKRNGGRVFAGWRPFSHPQLGSVEVGGIDPIRGFWNPPEGDIAGIASRMAKFVLAMASAAPNLDLALKTEQLGDGLRRIRLLVTNTGFLPTYVTAGSRDRSWNSPIQLTAKPSNCRLVAGPASTTLDHMAGWGRGKDEESDGPFFQKSGAIVDTSVTWIVEGSGTLEIEAGSPRLGWKKLVANDR